MEHGKSPKESVLSDKPKQPDGKPTIGFGSDAIAEQLARLDLDYIALVPGSSYRGLHDSLVNYNGNTKPAMLVCLHEEHTIAIAHGYAKVAEKPMAAGVHANVGLMHASMSVFNAFCDRVPILVLGATGPLDAAKRRPWIDHVHTATDQAALIRPFVKFDDQPHSATAAIHSLIHATAAASSKPCAPTYICLDLSIQEDEVDLSTLHFPETKRYLNTVPPGPSNVDVSKIVSALEGSKRPLFLLGRMNRRRSCWDERIKLAKRYNARVLTDLKQACSFPTDHPLHPCPPSVFVPSQASDMIRSADVIVSFDWVDLAGTLKASHEAGVEPISTIVHISLDSALHNGWSQDHFALPPADMSVRADPDKAVSALLSHGKEENHPSEWLSSSSSQVNGGVDRSSGHKIFMGNLANALYNAIPPENICLVRVPLGWNGSDLRASHPLAFMGMDGGAGIGSGPGQVVGTALALNDVSPDLVPVAVLGDGDFLMGSSALWTAARYRLGLLVICANNGSYFNDEVHQERIAQRRGRNVENKWIGMRLDDPAPDIHQIARGLGCTTVVDRQVADNEKLAGVLEEAVSKVKQGKVVVVDVQVLPEGYSSALEKAK